MLPRTKANYSFKELFSSMYFSLRGIDSKTLLIKTIKKKFAYKNIILTPSGRCGLYFLLRTIDKPKVIIPAYTCNAVVEACLLAKKEIVYIDVPKNNFNIDLTKLQQHIDKNSIMIATHQYGIPCAIEEIQKMCTLAGTYLIEDMAGALGGKVKNRFLGTFGDAAFYSFDSTKLITVPMKAGFITLNSQEEYNRCKQIYQNETSILPKNLEFKNFLKATILIMIENKYLYKIFHFFYFQLKNRATLENNVIPTQKSEYYLYDVSNFQSHIAYQQLSRIDLIIEKRKKLQHLFYNELKSCKSFLLQEYGVNAKEWCCIRFPILIHQNKYHFYKIGNKEGIDFAFSFSHIVCPDENKNSIELSNRVLNIPFYYKLDVKEINQIIQKLKKIDKELTNEPIQNV